jgi:NAD(P)H dehydrogenase (quinone)
MAILLVVAHPNSRSFTHALGQAFAEGAAASGRETDLIDLYAGRFDPCLSEAELAGTRDPVIQGFQDRLRRADGLALAFPVWWGSPPAILTGWLQRVFSYGFAFTMEKGAPRGLLRWPVALLSVGGGPAPAPEASPLGPLTAALQFCGVTDIRPQAVWEIGPKSPPEARAAALASARTLGSRFPD